MRKRTAAVFLSSDGEQLQRSYGDYGHKLTKHFDPTEP